MPGSTAGRHLVPDPEDRTRSAVGEAWPALTEFADTVRHPTDGGAESVRGVAGPAPVEPLALGVAPRRCTATCPDRILCTGC